MLSMRGQLCQVTSQFLLIEINIFIVKIYKYYICTSMETKRIAKAISWQYFPLTGIDPYLVWTKVVRSSVQNSKFFGEQKPVPS